MSIVIVGITPQFVVAMSDGRISNLQPNENLEGFKKICKINKDVCIGITGHLYFFDEVFSRFNAVPNKNLKTLKVEQVFDLFYKISKEVKQENPLFGDSNIVVCGITSNNTIESIGFSTKNFIIDKQDAKGSGLAIQVLSDYPNVFQIAKNNILKYDNLIKGMEETIRYISTVDITVNDNIFMERIDL